MKKIILIFSLLFFTFSYSQSKSYEEIGLDFFIKEIVPKHFNDSDEFRFKGDILDASPISSFCIKLKHLPNYDTASTTKIDVKKYKKIKKRNGIFGGLFIQRNKKQQLLIYRHYPYKNNYVVVIHVSHKEREYFFSIEIDSNTKKVIRFCDKIYDV